EVGLKLNVTAGLRFLGKLYIDDFRVEGPASYTIDFGKQAAEFATITPGTTNHGSWSLNAGGLQAMSVGTAEFYTGNYYASDYHFETSIIPRSGTGHCVSFRAKGAQMGYVAGLTEPGKAGLFVNSDGLATLAECDFDWAEGERYEVSVSVEGERINLSINGRKLFDITDGSFRHGMVGFFRTSRGRCEYGAITVTEL
ncbi:MAG TPA: ADP-ribosylglycohydrolase family protein, partial [Spirochaetia bacterium]|nr:ADP-ribosylglycohydrolase family protein [Spirochaetia bacterium]